MPEPRLLANVDLLAIPVAWNVRGDPQAPRFVAAVERRFGIALPQQPNTSARDRIAGDADRIDRARALLWLGPASWLCIGLDATCGPFHDARRALSACGGALFDVSASYAAWRVAGERAAVVLNRGCPLDLHPRAFPAGHCAQSLLGHVNALFWRPDESPAFVVMVARSFAADAGRDLLAWNGE